LFRRIIAIAIVTVAVATATAVTALGQHAATPSTRHHSKSGRSRSTGASRPSTTTATGLAPSSTTTSSTTTSNTEAATSSDSASQLVRPSEKATQIGLVALKNRDQALAVLHRFGKRALWAYSPREHRFESTLNYDPPGGATLYTTKAASIAVPSGPVPHRGHPGHAGSTGRTSTSRTSPSTSTTTSTTAAPATTTTTAPVVNQANTAAASSAPTPLGVGGTWRLTFDDEFSNDSSLNTAVWTPYWFSNGSTSNDTTMDSSNVSLSGGTLNLTLNGTGGLVSTNPSDGVAGHTGYQFTYGFVEARIYLPPSGSAVANWPAFWTVGQNWPTDGELDVMEGLSGQACFHFHDSSGGPGTCASGNFTGWHTYGADWEPGSVTCYYDGQEIGSVTTGITSEPMYLILENSGGSDGGPTVQPSVMKVQYVRVWQH